MEVEWALPAPTYLVFHQFEKHVARSRTSLGTLWTQPETWLSIQCGKVFPLLRGRSTFFVQRRHDLLLAFEKFLVEFQTFSVTGDRWNFVRPVLFVNTNQYQQTVLRIIRIRDKSVNSGKEFEPVSGDYGTVDEMS